MEDDIRIGIIGSGGIASAHVESYQKLAGVRIAAVSDLVPGRAEEFIQRHKLEGAKPFLDYREMLALDLDAVSVCTYNAAHFQPAVDSLLAGKHVLIEKPLSVTLAEAAEMVRASRETGKMLSVGFQSRYDEAIVTARRLVSSGELGRVYYMEIASGRRKGIPGGTFISKKTAGGGAVLDIGCYSLDTAMYILGHPRPLTVSAFTTDYFGTSPVYSKTAASNYRSAFAPEDFDVEDFGVAMVRLEGDIALFVKTAWAMHMDSLGDALILGTDGGLRMGESLKLYHDKAGRSAQTEISVRPRHHSHLFDQKVREFVEAIRTGGQAPIPAEEVLLSQAIIDAIYRSATARREVEVELPDSAHSHEAGAV